jgi:hypothetical protein
MNCICGIDPGKTGGIALLYEDGATECQPMPLLPGNRGRKREFDFFEIADLITQSHVIRTYVEKTYCGPKMGRMAAYSFGEGAGFLRGVMISAGISFEYVSARVWMKEMLGSNRTHSDQIKVAQGLYPQAKIKKHHGIAAALLIATYGLRRISPSG